MAQTKVYDYEKELEIAREVFKSKRETGQLTGARVLNVRFYHNSKTKHNAATFILDNNETVYKEFKETDWLNVVTTFTRVKNLIVWYDKDKMVQQFILDHQY
ncbi:MAG: hypothetical protein HQM08_26160 [Candidatus Riflebacteria bacterium]|nr:hypothetical protein [Candidatus Riflebacteria bacterium]